MVLLLSTFLTRNRVYAIPAFMMGVAAIFQAESLCVRLAWSASRSAADAAQDAGYGRRADAELGLQRHGSIKCLHAPADRCGPTSPCVI
jgi:hypothetical protein